MRIFRLASLPFMLVAASNAFAQSTEIEVNDGTTGTCYRASGASPCSFFTAPTIDTFVSDATGQSSEITTTSSATSVRTSDSVGSTWSGLNITNNGTALESSDPAGYAGVGTQTGVSSITGLQSGQFVATGDNTLGQSSGIQLEGTVGLIRTRDTVADTLGFVQTSTTGTVIGYATPSTGAPVATISSNAAGHQVLGNTTLDGTFSVTGAATMSGIDNQGVGITNAGLVSGVSVGVVSASSTDAVNGSQLYVTNTNVAAAQATANTALANAATAQSTANTALANAATAQTTANTANATANTALANAAMAQTTANTALTNAATAQTTANTANSTANTALTNAATAQTTANTALTNAATAQTTANTAAADAVAARTTATTAMNSATSAVSVANTANANATNAYKMASGFDTRISGLEDRMNGFDDDIERVDRMAGRGVAIATALASMPDIEQGKTMGFGIGVGSYNGENAVSVAFAVRASENAKFRFNGGTAGDGKFAFGAGGMFSW